MKKLLVFMIFITHCYLQLHAGNSENDYKIGYGDKGVWELFGSGSFSTQFYQDNREYEFNLTPGIAYFVGNRIHIGLKNMLLYTISSSEISKKWHHFYDYTGFLSCGYVLQVKQKLYLDCMADYGRTLSQSDDRRYYSLISALKYDLNQALLILDVSYRYIDYDTESIMKDYSMLQLGFGISFYL
jgi:hypothetical protein